MTDPRTLQVVQFLTDAELQEQEELARKALLAADHRYSDGCARVHVHPMRYLVMIERLKSLGQPPPPPHICSTDRKY